MENVAGIVGLGAALEEISSNMKENIKKVSALRDRLISRVLQIPRVRLTGDPTNRFPNQLDHSSLRFSLNEDNSEDDVDYILEKLPVIVARLRGISTVWNTVKAEAKS